MLRLHKVVRPKTNTTKNGGKHPRLQKNSFAPVPKWIESNLARNYCQVKFLTAKPPAKLRKAVILWKAGGQSAFKCLDSHSWGIDLNTFLQEAQLTTRTYCVLFK